MLWKDTLLGDVGSDVARTARLRNELRSCQRIQRFLTADRTCTQTDANVCYRHIKYRGFKSLRNPFKILEQEIIYLTV